MKVTEVPAIDVESGTLSANDNPVPRLVPKMDTSEPGATARFLPKLAAFKTLPAGKLGCAAATPAASAAIAQMINVRLTSPS